MPDLGSIVFLLILLGIPLIMIGLGIWRLGGWIASRRGVVQQIRSGRWQADPARAPDLARILQQVGLSRPQGEVYQVHRTGEGADTVWAASFRWRDPGPAREHRQGGALRVLVASRSEPGPIGVVQPRRGGLFEQAVLQASDALGWKTEEHDGFEWALVHREPQGRAWLDAQVGEALRSALTGGETLYLGADYLVLSLPEGPLDQLLDDGGARLRSLRETVATRAGEAG
ncbi:MAG: hypothetical protein EA397_12750 [Deltaproteobacteria bacterium]|nr:MAG: hypothetical protein EA397_12750 [Deltaproteobacteria bacterium]